MIGYVIYEDKKLPYTILTNKKLKNLYIELHPQTGIIVKNPNFPLQKVEQIVQQKAKWIFEKSLAFQDKLLIRDIYENEKKVLLFGKKTFLHVKKDLESFYKQKTQEILLPLVEKYAKQMNVTFSKVSFRKAKKRWGSCSGVNALSFNTSIAQLPKECIEYIVIHELAHIKHKHHQKSFYAFVAKHCPDYKSCEAKIKNYSPQI